MSWIFSEVLNNVKISLTNLKIDVGVEKDLMQKLDVTDGSMAGT